MLDFFEFSNEMLGVTDRRGYALRLNRAWTKTLGWSIEELSSRPYIEFIHPDDVPIALREIELLFGGAHETIWLEQRWRAKDGSYRWLAWYAQLDPDTGQLIGATRDVTEQKLKAGLLRNLIEVQEKEKQFLCHEFHDGLIQYAVGALMLLEAYKQTDDASRIDGAIDNLRRGIEDGRRVIQGIRPAVLDDGSLRDALEELIRQSSNPGLKVEWECDPEVGPLPEATQITAYRIVQEALNNARKHSGSDAVAVSVRKEGHDLRIEIRDAGRGFDVASARQRGFGLRGMSERAQLAVGECVIQSTPGAGTAVLARLLIAAADDRTIAPAAPPRI